MPIADIELTAKQWLYLECLQDFVDSGRPPLIIHVSKEARISRRSVAGWRRDRRFLKACAIVVRAANRVDEELADRANLRMAMQGSAAHYELLLRRRGLYEQLPPETPGASSPNGPQAVAGVQVAFYGLPMPPTPAERDAVNPPSGSTMILSPAGKKP